MLDLAGENTGTVYFFLILHFTVNFKMCINLINPKTVFHFLVVTDAPPPTTRPVTVNDISCDFENDFCDYAQATDDLFDWTRHQGPTKASGSGPNFDHTFGTADGNMITITL